MTLVEARPVAKREVAHEPRLRDGSYRAAHPAAILTVWRVKQPLAIAGLDRDLAVERDEHVVTEHPVVVRKAHVRGEDVRDPQLLARRPRKLRGLKPGHVRVREQRRPRSFGADARPIFHPRVKAAIAGVALRLRELHGRAEQSADARSERGLDAVVTEDRVDQVARLLEHADDERAQRGARRAHAPRILDRDERDFAVEKPRLLARGLEILQRIGGIGVERDVRRRHNRASKLILHGLVLRRGIARPVPVEGRCADGHEKTMAQVGTLI